MIDMEPIIFAAFVLETALLIPLLIVGYCDRKKYKDAEKLYNLPTLKIGGKISRKEAGETQQAVIKNIEISREKQITYQAETTDGKTMCFSEEDIGVVIYTEDGYEKNSAYN